MFYSLSTEFQRQSKQAIKIKKILNEVTSIVVISKLNSCEISWFFTSRVHCRPILQNEARENVLFGELNFHAEYWGAPSIWSCAPKIFSSEPKISAVRLNIYTWSHKCSQSQTLTLSPALWKLLVLYYFCFLNKKPGMKDSFKPLTPGAFWQKSWRISKVMTSEVEQRPTIVTTAIGINRLLLFLWLVHLDNGRFTWLQQVWIKTINCFSSVLWSTKLPQHKLLVDTISGE